MLCKSCHYPLKQLSEPRCPECGREFDPDDPETFESRKRSGWDPVLVITWGVMYIASFVVVFLADVSSPWYFKIVYAATGAFSLSLWFAPVVLIIWAAHWLIGWVRHKF